MPELDPEAVAALRSAAAHDELRLQLRAQGVDEADIDRLLAAGSGTVRTKNGADMAVGTTVRNRQATRVGDRTLPSQTRAARILLGAAAAIIAVVLGFILR